MMIYYRFWIPAKKTAGMTTKIHGGWYAIPYGNIYKMRNYYTKIGSA